jgi:tRNA U34 5-methylaminomethyl-2-thiouridine-forming methyltransferase MnmC
MSDDYQIVTVASGARSVRSLRDGETFHPVVGPMIEARGLHVRQQHLAERARGQGSSPFVVWDVGLGAAANAIAALEAFRDAGEMPRAIELHSFDRTLAPLKFALSRADELGYFAGWENETRGLLCDGIARCGQVTWRAHTADFRDSLRDSSVPAPHSVMFDPYSPPTNPELWNLQIFKAIRERVGDEACVLTSYSCSTAVRVTLLLAGWLVGRGAATGEKKETTVAATHIALLADPLEVRWLDRVRRSTAPGPLTGKELTPRSAVTIADELSRHAQFA